MSNESQAETPRFVDLAHSLLIARCSLLFFPATYQNLTYS